MLVKHVQRCVTPVLIIAKGTLKWYNVKNYAGIALMPAASVQRNAGMVIASMHRNVQMPAVHVPMNVKSMTMNIASSVQRNVGNVKQNAERFPPEYLLRASVWGTQLMTFQN